MWCGPCREHTIGLSFFFFKQKTAYEMRISDWSSDVCSSDLAQTQSRVGRCLGPDRDDALRTLRIESCRRAACAGEQRSGVTVIAHAEHDRVEGRGECRECPIGAQRCGFRSESGRSEEHTSELQSLMRLSYAVFCLQKKK